MIRVRPRWEIVSDLCARAVVCVLFALLSANVIANFIRTGKITGLLLLASESLVVVLTVVRYRAETLDRSAIATVTTFVSVLGPPLVRAVDGHGLVPDPVTAAASAFGLMLVIGGKVTLGRRFGITPAYRGSVAMRGPYVWVRHPIYTGYIITYIAFLLANPTERNLILLGAASAGLVIRILREERLLVRDPEYRTYSQRVSFRLIPGLF